MANIQYSAIVSDARGSIGGVTLSRGRGGAIARARVKPVNPRSALQSTRRAHLAHITKMWSGTLTEQERDDWRAYAAGTSWTNKLGQTISGAGNSAMLRHNLIRGVFGMGARAGAPFSMGHAGGIELSFSAENDTGKIQMDLPGGSYDKNVNSNVVGYSMALPAEAGRVTAPAGFRYFGKNVGNDVENENFPFEFTAPYTMAEGQRITIRCMFQDDQMRNSGPFFASAIAAPSI